MAEKERHQCNGEEGSLLISRTDKNWNAGFSFDRLREYKEEHGHCCPANDRTKDDNTTPPSRSKLVSS